MTPQVRLRRVRGALKACITMCVPGEQALQACPAMPVPSPGTLLSLIETCPSENAEGVLPDSPGLASIASSPGLEAILFS